MRPGQRQPQPGHDPDQTAGHRQQDRLLEKVKKHLPCLRPDRKADADLAFQSFSRSPSTAGRFADFGEPFPPDQPNLPGLGRANVLLRYRSAAGQRGLSLGDDEVEVVLPRGQPFRILDEQEITFTDPKTGEVRRLVIYDIGLANET